MAIITINGTPITVDEDITLMSLLRDTLQITSVKDGCSEGACGTCTVLVDGKPVKACVQKAKQFDGKSVLTVEGVSEKELYVTAFGEAGAVQCGFCIPGMVLCAKALLDETPNPTRAQARKAIDRNLCRCTGYQKIIDAVLLAGALKRGEAQPKPLPTSYVGAPIPRIDVREKVLGTAIYVDDRSVEGMIYGSALRSEHPRAKILAIHIEKAKALDGVVAVLTAEDIKGDNKIGHIQNDWYTLIPVGGITHYLGDAVALIAATSKEVLKEAKSLIEVEYEVLPAVFSPEEAMAPNAPQVHRDGNILKQVNLHRGDPDAVIATSAHVVTNTYETPFTEHAFLEPESALAIFDGTTMTIHSSDQSPYSTQHECARMLSLPSEQVVVKNSYIGGGFGGKEDMSVQHHAALLAQHTKSAVKVTLTRQESILVHPKRHPAKMVFTTACDERGNLTAMRATIITDTGAYASLGGPVLQRACTHAAGPYHYQNIHIEGKAVYTNNPPSGAFRGFGVTQSCFATECNLNQLAEKVGITPWEIRYKNAIRPGEELPNGQIANEGTAFVETLEAVKELYHTHPRAGIGCAMKNAGVGVGLPDYGRCTITITDGKVAIHAGASCIGQGLGTVLTQIVCETLSIPPTQVVYHNAQTHTAPDSGVTSGSRQTLVTGEATRRACVLLQEALHSKSMEELEGASYDGEYLAQTDPMGSEKKNPVSHVAYGYATQVVLLNEDGTVEKVIAAHDIGRAINPQSVEGQIEGGVVMSLGYALTEKFPLKEGRPTGKLGTLGLFRATKTPEIISILVEKNKDQLAFGAIGVGEIVSIPTAPAVQNAYHKLDGIFRTTLPLRGTHYNKEALE